MNDVDKARWQEMHNVLETSYGLKIDDDPLNFFYRARVVPNGYEWDVTVWQIYTRDVGVDAPNPRGQWVEIGTYPSLQGAKIRARRMAKLFEAASKMGGS